MMKEERVKFYERNDFYSSYMIKLALEKLKSFDDSKENYLLEDILEYYNIVKYIDNARHLLKSDEDRFLFSNTMKAKLMSVIGKYFNNLNNDNILNISLNSQYEYCEVILELFDKFNTFKRIESNIFFDLLEKLGIPDKYVYQNKKIVQHYDKQLRKRLLENEMSFKLLLMKYLSTEVIKEIFLPKSLDKNDKEIITINYIKSNQAHINDMEIIISLPVFEDFSISDDTRILAKDRYDELAITIFGDKNDKGFHTDLQVCFSDELKEEFKFEYVGNKISLFINKKWISENLDYPTLLNNLIYVLGLTDSNMRISCISKINSMPALTKVFTDRKLKNYYFHGYEFQCMNKLMQIAVAAYRDYLQSVHNIYLEDVVQWFFDSYLHDEFLLNEFSVNMPSKDSTYLEKCRTICCEIESVLKQYDSLVKYGKVRHDIIEISSKPVSIETVQSFIAKKYVYPQINNCQQVMCWLFSDQTLLTYFKGNKKQQEYSNFYDMMYHEKININDYSEYQKNDLKYLFNEKIIDIDENGHIFFCNLNEVSILYDLYINEFGVYNNYIKLGCEDAIKALLQREWISVDSSLLSIQESSYMNFYLNKQKYFNGYDLRNKYLHGTQRKQGQDAELHKLNYNILLSLYLILVIKINDDLCQNADSKT